MPVCRFCFVRGLPSCAHYEGATARPLLYYEHANCARPVVLGHDYEYICGEACCAPPTPALSLNSFSSCSTLVPSATSERGSANVQGQLAPAVHYVGAYVEVRVIDGKPWAPGSPTQFNYSTYKVPARITVGELAEQLGGGKEFTLAEALESTGGGWEMGQAVDCATDGAKKEIGALGWTPRAVQQGGPVWLALWKT